MNYDRALFGMKLGDCKALARALERSETLVRLQVWRGVLLGVAGGTAWYMATCWSQAYCFHTVLANGPLPLPPLRGLCFCCGSTQKVRCMGTTPSLPWGEHQGQAADSWWLCLQAAPKLLWDGGHITTNGQPWPHWQCLQNSM